MKTLVQVWPDVPTAWADTVITGLATDSRQVQPGFLFLATAGTDHDATAYVAAALERGARAVLVDVTAVPETRAEASVPVLAYPGLAQQVGALAARWFDHPADAMPVVAVTGTNGKTSIANLVAAAWEAHGGSAGVIGTLGNGRPGQLQPSRFTTPDPLQTQTVLAQFRDQALSLVALEASSHGLEQGRLVGTAIDVAVFTNLTRDHLDYHGTLEAYAAAKARLFTWPTLKAAVVNQDDPQGSVYAALLAPSVSCWRYSLDPAADVELVAEKLTLSLSGLSMTVRTPLGRVDLKTALIGRFNAANALAVLGVLLALGLAPTDAAAALAQAPAVPGRMMCFRAPGRPLAVIDFAHTPDALTQALRAVREHASGQVWVVFGCGGGRDPGKRAEMGHAAGTLADHVVLTWDNPRFDDPDVILQDIQSGLPSGVVATVIADRRQAIHHALRQATANDIVLIAGKGHETYQEIAGVRHPYSDIEPVQAALEWAP